MINRFTKPKSWETTVGFDFKHDRVLDIAKRDPMFYRCQVYEVIAGVESFVSPFFEKAWTLNLGEGPVVRSDLLIFKNVLPHIDEVRDDDNTYFAHVFLHGTGIFKSFNSRTNPDKATSIIPFKPGTVLLMNQRIKHSVETHSEGFVYTFCQERIFNGNL